MTGWLEGAVGEGGADMDVEGVEVVGEEEEQGEKVRNHSHG